MADSIIYHRVRFAPWSNLDSEIKKVTKCSFLDVSMNSRKIEHALRPHLWIVQEWRNMPKTQLCLWVMQMERPEYFSAYRPKLRVTDTDGIWRRLSHYTPRCCRNSWDALWPLPFCEGQGRGLRQQRSGSSSHALHPLHKGPRDCGDDSFIPHSLQPPRRGLTPCLASVQVRIQASPLQHWEVLGGF